MGQIIIMDTTKITSGLGITDWIVYIVLFYGAWKITEWIYKKAWGSKVDIE